MNLKNHLFFVIIIFLLLQSFMFSTSKSFIDMLGGFAAGDDLYSNSSWLSYIFLILLGMVSIVLIAYLLGKTLSLPYLVGWSKDETMQIFVSLLIFLTFAAIYIFVDSTLLPQEVYNSFNLNVPKGQSHIMFYANKYLDSNIKAAKSTIGSIAKKASAVGLMANERTGIRMIPFIKPLPFLQAAFSMPPPGSGEPVIRISIYTVVMNSAVGILSGLMAQKVFLGIVCTRLGPFMVLLGLLFRSFFATRKLGGLLLAAGIGVVLIFPLTYTLDWITYTFTQDAMSVKHTGGEPCPDLCKDNPPLYYIHLSGNSIRAYNLSEQVMDYLGHQFSDDDKKNYKKKIKLLNKLDELSRYDNNRSYTNISVETQNGLKIIYSCSYPLLKPSETVDGVTIGMCPKGCRVDPYPITNQKCNNVTIRMACARVPKGCIKHMNFTLKGIKNSKILTKSQKKDFESNINDCPNDCKIIAPLKTDCSDKCLYVPSHCRVVYDTGSPLSSDPICEGVVNITNSDSGKCAFNETDPHKSCVYIVPSDPSVDCTGCVMTPSYAKYSPPVYADCLSLCSISDIPSSHVSQNLFNGVPSTFGAGSGNELAVAVLMLPAYILPLFGIGVTLMFIRTFSGFLGGDMEIPGMEKIL